MHEDTQETKEITFEETNSEPVDFIEEKTSKRDSAVKDILQLILLVALLGLIFYVRQMPLFSVVGHSMDSTYSDGDVLVGDKNATIQAGNILIISSHVLEERIVKRCIALPGDTVKIKDNTVYVNGERLQEDYIKEPMITEDLSVTLADDEYFVMGDNRNHSTDSREIGVIPQEEITAKVIHNLTKEYSITYKRLTIFKNTVIALAGCYIVITLFISLVLPLFRKE